MTEKQSLAAKMAAENEKEAANKQTELSLRLKLAEIWDALNPGFRDPRFIYVGSIQGAVGQLSWDNVEPDELVTLLTALAPTPFVTYKDGGIRYHHMTGAKPVPERAAEVVGTDGVDIRLNGSRGGSGEQRLEVSWNTAVREGLFLRLKCELKRHYQLHPSSYRKEVRVAGQFLRFEGPTEIRWPSTIKDKVGILMFDAGLKTYTYQATPETVGDVYIRGRDTLALVKFWESEANRIGEATKAAFDAAYQPVLERGLPTREEILQKAEEIKEDYQARKLKAGTLEQTACLETSQALQDRAVAEKHWTAYCRYHGIEERNYFDYHTWACFWLKRCDLYEVPMGEGTYKYGHAWL